MLSKLILSINKNDGRKNNPPPPQVSLLALKTILYTSIRSEKKILKSHSSSRLLYDCTFFDFACAYFCNQMDNFITNPVVNAKFFLFFFFPSVFCVRACVWLVSNNYNIFVVEHLISIDFPTLEHSENEFIHRFHISETRAL